jgi:hypothetical protein
MEEKEEEIFDEEEEKEEDTEDKEPEKVEMTKEEYEEYQKLKEKDLNFQKLRNGTKKDKEDIKKTREELDSRAAEFLDTLEKERKADALSMLIGDDIELRKKALFNYDRIKDDAKTKEEIYKKMKEAVNMTGVREEVNPMYRDTGHSGYRGFEKSNKESEDSKEMRETMRITDEDKKKYGGDNWKPNLK